MISSIFVTNHSLTFPVRRNNHLFENFKMVSDLEKFSSFLKGDWSNKQQSMEFPALWSHIHVCYQSLPDTLFNTPSFYVESAYDYSLDKPYKTAIVALKKVGDAIEMQNYKIKQPEKYWYGSYDSKLLSDLNENDIIKLPSICDTIFKYDTDEKIYKGKTRPGKKCVILRGNLKTYLDSRITISEDSYSSWDIGRDLETDIQVWGATSGPFCFKKN
jgi:hypothetical protein